MKKLLLTGVACAAVMFAVWGIFLTRDGDLVTPKGAGRVTTATGTFEAFPLPAYAAEPLGDDYKSYLVEVAPGIKIHVLEVGSGYPVYMQHGAPTSGFLYRNVAEHLPRDQFRVIMPTLPGLGFSSKPPASDHTIENQINWMTSLLAQLGLEQLIFVGHDWGGPIGVGALERLPDLLTGAVILNTVLDAPKVEREVGTLLRLVQTPVIGEFMFEGVASIFDQLPGTQNDPETMPPSVLDLYRKPLDDAGNGKGPLALVRMAVTSPDHPDIVHFTAIERYISESTIPVEIVWGMNDPILGKRLADMKAILPRATVVETTAGHFLQEEAPQDIAASVQRVRLDIQP